MKKNTVRIAISLIFMMGALIISVIAPGNTIRSGWLPEPSFAGTFYISFKALGQLYIYKMLPQMPWALLFSIPFIYLGFLHGENKEKKQLNKIFKPLLLSILLLALAHYIFVFPACYLLSEAGPDRSLSLLIFITVVFITAWSYYFGYKFIKKIPQANTVFLISLAAISSVIITITLLQYQQLTNYADAVDKRNQSLKQLQADNNKNTVTVSRLPSSGYLYSAEISSDTNYFGNEHYRMGLFLGFKVKTE